MAALRSSRKVKTNMNQIVSYLSAVTRLATPILFAALGLLVNERAGVSNIGAEGMMLSGALAGVLGSYLTGSAWAGLIYGCMAGALMGALFAFLVVYIHADQTVMGAAINILALGITTTVFRVVLGVNTKMPEIKSFGILEIPLLSKIPFIGDIFFKQNILVYFALLLVPAIHYFLFKTEPGLTIRGVGEYPKACDTVGINVYRVRTWAIIFGGFMCGLGGCFVSMGSLSFFAENMISGRGFIALAVIVFGRWKPVGILMAALMFGAGEALQLRLQTAGSGIPSQFLVMIPYLLTILAVCGLIGKKDGPAAIGEDYVKE